MNDQTFLMLVALAFLGFVLTTGALTVAIALTVRTLAKWAVALTVFVIAEVAESRSPSARRLT